MNALNRLAGYKFETPLPQHAHRPPTAVQEKLLEHVRSAFEEAGPIPEGMSADSALRDLMSSINLYDGEPGHLASYDPEKLKILGSRIQPRPLHELLPPHVLPLFHRRHAHIERSPEEFESFKRENPGLCPKQPHWDPKLRNDAAARLDFFKRLYRAGILSFRKRIRSKVGVFFVKKKDPGAIRMIIDARITNCHHRRPPVTRLGSAANYIDLDLSEELMGNQRDHRANLGWGSEMDVSDCFYRFEIKEMASWFGIDSPSRVGYWNDNGFGLQTVYDEDLTRHVPVTESDILYPVIAVMPMGWTWALFFANESVASIVRECSLQASREMREKLPVPQLDDVSTLTSTYVDNVAIVGRTKEDVARRVAEVDRAFAEKRIPIVWTYDEPVRVLETVGCIVDFESKILKNKPHRLWRVHLAGVALTRRSKVRTRVVEVWLGHATSVMRLCPALLSVFDKIYRFVRISDERRIPLWPAVRSEITMACNLVWLCRADLGSAFVKQVDMGDSANHGYAMMTAQASAQQLREACRFREKWRYMAMPDSVKEIVRSHGAASGNKAIYEFGHLESALRSPNPARTCDGLGLETNYASWLQDALREGSWLKTSSIISQFWARKTMREDVECPALVPPLDPMLVDKDNFSLLWAKRWKRTSEHIGMKEARVALSSLKRTARVASLAGLKKLTLSDNLPVVLCFEKGRSSRPGLNRLCRVAGALQAGLGIRWRLRHIETKRNVADSPSRWFERSRDVVPHGDVAAPQRPACRGLDVEKLQTVDRPDCHNDVQKEQKMPLNLFDILHGQAQSSQPRRCRGVRGCGQCEADMTCSMHTSPSMPSTSSTSHRATPKAPGLFQRGVFWEIFSGSGHLSQASRAAGLGTLPPIDIKKGPAYDLIRRSTQNLIKQLILEENVSVLHMGTPCAVFSTARHNIKNHVRARARERVGCELAFFSAELARFCHSRGIQWSIENPASSRLWQFPAIEELFLLPGVKRVFFPYCQCGTKYKKPTMLLTNCELLEALSRSCTHRQHTTVLRGRKQHQQGGSVQWCNATELAGVYPPQLCRAWAQVMRPALLDVSEKPGADPQEFALKFEIAARKGGSKQFELCKQFEGRSPAILESIAFGQHTRAEAALRRQKRDFQKTSRKTAADWCCCGPPCQKTSSITAETSHTIIIQ